MYFLLITEKYEQAWADERRQYDFIRMCESKYECQWIQVCKYLQSLRIKKSELSDTLRKENQLMILLKNKLSSVKLSNEKYQDLQVGLS